MLKHALLLTLPLLAAVCLPGQPTEAFSETWGHTVLKFPPQSDTFVSLIFPRPDAHTGQITAVNPATVESEPTFRITFAGTPFTLNQFTSNAAETYYILICTGPLDENGQPTAESEEGAYATIVANDTNSITIEPSETGAFTTIANIVGQQAKIIPYWTLETLFPNGQGIAQVSGPREIGRKSEVLFPALPNVLNPESTEGVGVGLNLAAALRLTLRTGNPPVWTVTAGSVPYVNQPLEPNSFLIVRNQTDGELSVSHFGPVNTQAIRIPVGTVKANVKQDNPVGFTLPIATKVKDLDLEKVVDPVFSIRSEFDEVLIFQNGSGINRAPSVRLRLRSFGWETNAGAPADDFVVEPGDAIVIRKRPGAVGFKNWYFLPERIKSLSGR